MHVSCFQGEVIVDSNGNTVEGVEGWGSNPKQCGIRIISAEEVKKYIISDLSNSADLRKTLETGM